jgi:hypothetical protein
LDVTAEDAVLACADFGVAATRLVAAFDVVAFFDGSAAVCGAAADAAGGGAGAVTSTVRFDAVTGARSAAGAIVATGAAGAPATGFDIRRGTASAATITRATPATAMLARLVRRRAGVNGRFIIIERFARVSGAEA